MADKEVKCPWCGAKDVPAVVDRESPRGRIRERNCANCGCTLAAYLVGEGDFMSSIRVFENEQERSEPIIPAKA